MSNFASCSINDFLCRCRGAPNLSSVTSKSYNSVAVPTTSYIFVAVFESHDAMLMTKAPLFLIKSQLEHHELDL
jgi:hypothetical protein